jgi:hypothetical protein
MDPALVNEIPIVFPPADGVITDEFWEHVLDQPITFLRDFVD